METDDSTRGREAALRGRVIIRACDGVARPGVVFRACVRSDRNWQDVSGAYTFFPAGAAEAIHPSAPAIRVVDRGTTPGIRIRAVAARDPSSQALHA